MSAEPAPRRNPEGERAATRPAFFGANLLEPEHGRWVPFVVSLAEYTHTSTRKTRRAIVNERVIVACGPRDRERPGVRRATPDGGRMPLRMARWRRKLFVVLSRNAQAATEFFGIPPNRVVELGAQVER